jgi:hypothetical protein
MCGIGESLNQNGLEKGGKTEEVNPEADRSKKGEQVDQSECRFLGKLDSGVAQKTPSPPQQRNRCEVPVAEQEVRPKKFSEFSASEKTS